MKDSRLKGIIALAVVTVLAFGVIYGSRAFVNNDETDNGAAGDGIDVADAEGINEAKELKDEAGNVIGYSVTSFAKGFAGNVVIETTFATDGKTMEGLTVVEHKETPGYGAAIEEEDYLNQFPGLVAPVSLGGGSSTEEATGDDTEAVAGGLQDGTYTVQDEEFAGGYRSVLTLQVEDGSVISVSWDAMNESGEFKSYLSSVGEYVMVEGNPTWKEQADALAASVIENQSLEGISMDEEERTDSVAGVSIKIGDFVSKVEEALELAANGEGTVEAGGSSENAGGSGVDEISGATYTNEAMVKAINNAYEFISAYLGN